MEMNNNNNQLNISWTIILLLFISCMRAYASTPNIKPPYQEVALELAVVSNNIDKVKELLSNGADIEGGRDDDYLLRKAINNGRYEMIKLLIDHGAQVKSLPNKFSPLHYTVRFSQLSSPEIIKIAKLLIDNGADINHNYNSGYPIFEDMSAGEDTTPIYWAMKNTDVVRFLIDSGAKLPKKDSISSSLWYTTVNNINPEIMQLLLNIVKFLIDSDTELPRITRINSSLWYAAVDKINPEAMQLLLNSHVPINQREYLLHSFVSLDTSRIGINFTKQGIDHLLEAGYRINTLNKDGNTPLHVAANYKYRTNLQLISLLLERGADPNKYNKNGNVAHCYVSNRHLDTDNDPTADIAFFMLLLSRNLDINARAKSNQQTVLDMLYEQVIDKATFEQLPLVFYLRQNGAKLSSEL